MRIIKGIKSFGIRSFVSADSKRLNWTLVATGERLRMAGWDAIGQIPASGRMVTHSLTDVNGVYLLSIRMDGGFCATGAQRVRVTGAQAGVPVLLE